MLVEIFCEIDDFCKIFEKEFGLKLLGSRGEAGRKSSLTASEIITICIYYHSSQFKTFKAYYNTIIQGYERSSFPNSVSYNRFIELRQKMIVPLLLFIRTKGLGSCNGVSIIDSTTLEVCHIRRASSHKLFRGVARKGKSSTGWFFGFKLHCVINSRGEIINFYITPGNVADNNTDVLDAITQDVFGKLIADKGYIGAFKQMFDKGITLIHGIRRNMKNKLMPLVDKLLLKKRGVIECVFGILKEWLGLESSKNRSQSAYFVQIFSAIAAYHFKPVKPHILGLEMDLNLCDN